MGLLPKAPDSNNATDYVVIVFVVTVASILVLATVSLIIAALFTTRQVDTLVGSLLDILTTIIGALIGFIAGKGAGRNEVHDEQAASAKDSSP